MIIKIQRLLGLAPIPRAKIISILETYNYFRKKTAQTIPNLCGFSWLLIAVSCLTFFHSHLLNFKI
jgi:hypothetical protein